MAPRMHWNSLLTTTRLGRGREDAVRDARSEFQRDVDRIVFCSAFRRLQDKTQVHPLPEIDYVRTRLTHSLEVASVGRSLGTLAGSAVREFEPHEPVPPAEFGNAVSAACLAHDIGNPPFGHPGEDAIRAWFAGPGSQYVTLLTPEQAGEFLNFEGNAQGFRILTRLQHPQNDGGLQLTHATLGAFTKYPRGAGSAGADGAAGRKYGYFAAESAAFAEVAEHTGLIARVDGAWCRHPLACLVEAADDLCYHVIDLEDGYRVGLMDFATAEALLLPIATAHGEQPLGLGYGRLAEDKGRLEYLRARAINHLVDAIVAAFRDHYPALMAGSFTDDLVGSCRYATELARIYELTMRRIYRSGAVMEVHELGTRALHEVLARAADAVFLGRVTGVDASLDALASEAAAEFTRYERLLCVTDFVAGMTDTYALGLYRRLTAGQGGPGTAT
ncbi:MAG: dGTP triphosphohydrolase [Pseudomonadota bacterium]